MKKSPNDHKQYQAITLLNGLRVLLVHNNATQKSAAALAVNVGHFSDPEHREGLAHFLEHMLFLGTKKYPDGSEYQKFISQHGGSNNAWTATEHTCYFLDINNAFFEEALDRFSQFFIAPLLSKDFIQSERENIDAEFKLKLKDDMRRLYDVHKETINPLHPFSKFSVGNNDTLKDSEEHCIYNEISEYYLKHYNASSMTLVLEGPQSLENLASLAQNKFSPIRSSGQSSTEITQPLYLPNHLSIQINVKPVKNDLQLIVSFAMPSIDKYYRHKPESVLAYLLGHEGPGSILSLLKYKQWALSLSAGSGINGSNFKDFNISLQLTEEGKKHTTDIITIIFQYIQLIKDKPLATFYYDEKQALSALAFEYAEKMRPLDSVSQLVINMQHYPEPDYIFGDYAMDGFCQDLIDTLLEFLTPANMRLIHINQHNEFNKTSKWYNVPYSVNNISKKNIDTWLNCGKNKSLNLPNKNPYIVQNPLILPVPTSENTQLVPSCIFKEDGYELWFKQDTTFNVPKGYIYIGIDSPLTIISTENIAMTRLFIDLYSDSIVEEHYDAELAGIQYHLYSHQGGMTLQVSGISEKQYFLLEQLLSSIKKHNFTEAHFNLLKAQLIKHWTNSDTSKSISQLFSVLSSTLQPKNPSTETLAQALSNITYEQFNIFKTLIFNEISVKVLVHGNWLIQQAQDINKLIKQSFNEKFSEEYIVNTPVIDIKSEGDLHIDLQLPEHDFATIIYYPIENKSLNDIAKTMLTSQLLSPLFFQEMRTDKQYGYLVGVGFIPVNRYPGIAFYIQSPNTESIILKTAIDDFISNAYQTIQSMDVQHWEHLKQGLASQLQEKDSSLRIKSQRFWAAISNDDTDFFQKNKLIETIKMIELNDIKLFIGETLVIQGNPDRITLQSHKNIKYPHSLETSVHKNKKMLTILNNCKRKF